MYKINLQRNGHRVLKGHKEGKSGHTRHGKVTKKASHQIKLYKVEIYLEKSEMKYMITFVGIIVRGKSKQEVSDFNSTIIRLANLHQQENGALGKEKSLPAQLFRFHVQV